MLDMDLREEVSEQSNTTAEYSDVLCLLLNLFRCNVFVAQTLPGGLIKFGKGSWSQQHHQQVMRVHLAQVF